MLKGLRHDWHRFRVLPGDHKRVFIEASLCMPFIWIAVHSLGLPHLQALLHRPLLRHGSLTSSDIQALSALVNAASKRSPAPTTCLTRSLYLAWLLRRRGVPAEFRIGVRIANGVLAAHAWVECGGSPVNDKDDIAKDFAPFERLRAVGNFDK